MKLLRAIRLTLVFCVLTLSLGPSTLYAAEPKNAETETLSEAQIDQLVAPIALYPDALLAQVLMASTYPLEIVQAARWVGANAKLKDKALEKSVQGKSWDPSIKSIALVSQVLQMMNDKLDWTQQLGDAFLSQQEDVMKAVQRLRKKADDAGNLKSSKQQKITIKTVESREVIVIAPASPEIIYVPAYNPTVVYGAWAYPAYPPYYYYPPGYVARGAFWFGAGVAVGAALWGNVNWGRNNVNINVNHYNNFNRTNIKKSNWNHNGNHRKGVPYKNRAVKERYGRGKGNTRSREQFRGRAKAGQKDLFRSAPKDRGGKRSAPKDRGGKRAAPKDRARTQARRTTPKREARPQQRRTSPRSQPRQRSTKRSSGRSPSAFDGIGRGKQTRSYSARGRSSRSSSRSFSGGGRGGGGRRGGGRRR